MLANKAQIKKIHTLKSKLQLREEVYRDMLANYGVDSSTRLKIGQATDFIQTLSHQAEKQGVWTTKKKKYDHLWNRNKNMASPAQLRKIEAMWKNVSRFENYRQRAEALDKFINRIVGVTNILWVEKSHVEKLIKAIEAMQ